MIEESLGILMNPLSIENRSRIKALSPRCSILSFTMLSSRARHLGGFFQGQYPWSALVPVGACNSLYVLFSLQEKSSCNAHPEPRSHSPLTLC